MDYACTQQQLEDHFKDCGQIARTTIRCNAKGQPMGYAYMEFMTQEAAVRSKAKTETLLCGRQITVQPKRKNLPRPKHNSHRGGHKMSHPGGMMNPLMMQGFAMMMAGMQGTQQRGGGFPKHQRGGRGGFAPIRGAGIRGGRGGRKQQ